MNVDITVAMPCSSKLLSGVLFLNLSMIYFIISFDKTITIFCSIMPVLGPDVMVNKHIRFVDWKTKRFLKTSFYLKGLDEQRHFDRSEFEYGGYMV